MDRWRDKRPLLVWRPSSLAHPDVSGPVRHGGRFETLGGSIEAESVLSLWSQPPRPSLNFGCAPDLSWASAHIGASPGSDRRAPLLERWLYEEGNHRLRVPGHCPGWI